MRKKEGNGDPAGGTQVNAEAITAAVNAAIKPLTDKIGTLETQLQANTDKVLNEKRQAVKVKFGLEDAAVNALQGDALDGLFAKCQTSTGINGGYQANADDQDQWKGCDLNAGMDEDKK
ncbi:hypothetical protein EDI29_22710 [Pectobacterium polonicum]|nr:hypothetical protein EDI29_22710 [Pectobacterium polonicum]